MTRMFSIAIMYRPNGIFYGDKSFFTGPDYTNEIVAKKNRKIPFIFSVSDELERMNDSNLYGDKVISDQVGLTGTDGIVKNNLWKSLIRKHKGSILIKDKKQSWGRRIQRHFHKFCTNTALHGLHYLADKDRLFIEKLYWFVTLTIVYYGCFLLIKDSVLNFLRNPAEITIENMATPVGLVPFPAITVCGSNQIKPTVFNFSAYFSMTSEEKASLNRTFLHKLDYTDMFCRLGQVAIGQDKLDISIFHYMLNHAHTTCEEIFHTVKWNNYTLEKPCEYMQPILTDLGLCYSFNLLPYKILLTEKYLEVVRLHNSLNHWSKINKIKWSPLHGYNGEPQKSFDIPFRTSGTGSMHALTLHLETRSEDYTQQCNLGSRGYTILMHSPTQIPTSSNARIGVSGSSYHWVTVVPRKIRTSEEVGLWAPEKRGCYYYDERDLLFFKIYTQVNCDIECESNYSLKVCGCVAYYHPRTLFTPVCGSNKMDCIEDSLTRFSELYTENIGECGCLPVCTQFEYESDVMSMDVAARLRSKKKRSKISSKSKENENSTSEYSIVSFTYQNRDMLGYLRDGKYSITDFLVLLHIKPGNLGGIAGLFLGFSWISILELTYFAVLRPLANIRLRYLARVRQQN